MSSFPSAEPALLSYQVTGVASAPTVDTYYGVVTIEGGSFDFNSQTIDSVLKIESNFEASFSAL